MKRFFFHCLAAIALTAVIAGLSFGQQRGAPPPTPTPEATESSHGQPVFQYFVVVTSTILILFIVCKPSRKTS
jgi:hypothetical protein